VKQGSFINLPAINPGDKALKYNAIWAGGDDAAYVKINLVSPLGYNVKDTTLYLAKPAAPKVVAVIHACKSVRVVFEKNEFCNEYALKYTVNGQTKTTAKTIDHYIDLKNLSVNTPCSISVVGYNDAGEGDSSAPVTIVPVHGFKTLPPVVWGIVPSATGFNVGLGWVFSDTFYEARYTTNPSDESSWKILTGIVFGAFKVTDIEPGKKYYVQVRNATQFGANRSEWSEMLEVTPGNEALTGKAKINGLLKSENGTVLSITPARNATSYRVSYDLNGKQIEENINRSEIEYYLLTSAGKAVVKNVQIQAIP
jgi:hypothetical protein